MKKLFIFGIWWALWAALLHTLFPHLETSVVMAGSLPLGALGVIGIKEAQALATWDSGFWSTTTPAASFTLTPAQILSGSSTYLTLAAGIGAGFNMTTPTAAALVAQYISAYGVPPAVGSTFTSEFSNQTGQTATLVGGTGVTINGTATIATVTNRTFLGTFTAIGVTPGNVGATVTLQNLGSRTN